MSSKTTARQRRRVVVGIKEALRDMRNQLSLLNHQVSVRVDLKDADLDSLELITRLGPLSPSALARHADLHPATVTGILDRLQRGGWITRERDPDAADRRAVAISAVRERGGELFAAFAGMNASMDTILGDYTDTELAVIADFIKRTTAAGAAATADLADGHQG